MSTNQIIVNQLVKLLKSTSGEFKALKGISFKITKGDLVAIVGKSGSGKTTLLNMISGIDRPTSGEIFIDDKAIHKMSETEKTSWRGRNIGVVFQFFQLLPVLTVLENVMIPMDLCCIIPASQRKSRARDLLQKVGLLEHANKFPNALSGGEQQRVAIARALANDPPIVVADEPTGNLDSRSAESIINLFRSLASEGKTIVIVTHSYELAKASSKTITIHDGEIIKEEMVS